MAWVHSGCVTLHNCHGLSEVQLLHYKTARLSTTGAPQRVEVLQPGWEVMDSAPVGCPPAWGSSLTQTLLFLGLAFTDRDSEALSCLL